MNAPPLFGLIAEPKAKHDRCNSPYGHSGLLQVVTVSSLGVRQKHTPLSLGLLMDNVHFLLYHRPRISGKIQSLGRALSFGTTVSQCLNSLIPDSAIWHKMQLHAQYSVKLYEICTTKRSWKDLHFEGIMLLYYTRLYLPPLQLFAVMRRSRSLVFSKRLQKVKQDISLVTPKMWFSVTVARKKSHSNLDHRPTWFIV